jgi:hypothetical protein
MTFHALPFTALLGSEGIFFLKFLLKSFNLRFYNDFLKM